MSEESPVYAMIENIGFEKGIEIGLIQGMGVSKKVYNQGVPRLESQQTVPFFAKVNSVSRRFLK